jgi:hypothetical protein
MMLAVMNVDPIFSRAKVQELRANAAQARDSALAEADVGLRRSLDDIAENWERLAL